LGANEEFRQHIRRQLGHEARGMRGRTHAVSRSIEIRWQSVYEVQPRIGAQVKTLAFRWTSH
jgi:hypothetical protein